MSPKNMFGLAREDDRSNRDEANKGPVKSFAATTTTTGTTATSKSSALGDAIKALSIWHAMKTGQKADESKPSESSSSSSPVHSEKEALHRSSDRDKASSRGGKKNSTARRKGAARLKWDEVVTRLGGNPAKGERFVIKQKLDPADLAESINDRYFQELMRSEL